MVRLISFLLLFFQDVKHSFQFDFLFETQTALHVACRKGFVECVQILLRAGAPIDVTVFAS